MSEHDDPSLIELAIMAAIFDQFRKPPGRRRRGPPRRGPGRRASERLMAIAIAPLWLAGGWIGATAVAGARALARSAAGGLRRASRLLRRRHRPAMEQPVTPL